MKGILNITNVLNFMYCGSIVQCILIYGRLDCKIKDSIARRSASHIAMLLKQCVLNIHVK